MDLEADSLNFYTPFFPHSVNLLSASTSSGKTSLVIDFIKNSRNCFVRHFSKVVIVHCNDNVSGSVYQELASPDLEVESCYLTEFVPAEYLGENDLLVFDDVSEVTPAISQSVNVLCHHLKLNTIFIITQSVLRESTLKSLLQLAHRVILFFSGVGASKVALYLKKFYFINLEIKDYLIQVISYAEKHKSVVLFELNDVNGRFLTKYFSIVNFDVFLGSDKRPTLIFPKMNETLSYESSFSDNSVSLPDISDLPRNAFVLVPAKNVHKKSVLREENKKKITDKETLWNDVNASIENSIVDGLKFRSQQLAKNLARHILNCKFLAISHDGKTLKIKGVQKSSVSVLDYLALATRVGGPNEKIEPAYYKITELLLKSKTPKLFIKNKNLFVRPSKSKKKIVETL